jgi:DNA-binding NtrC family response regulator
LNDAVISLPPLRERREDIPDLVRYFIERYGVELGSPNPSMPTGEAVGYLQQKDWPGNVRELRNVVRKALLLSRGYSINRELLERALAQTSIPRPAGDQTITGFISELLARARRGELENVQLALTEAVERELYAQAIRLANGDQTRAGTWIGVSRPTMREKLLKYGLHRSQDGT